jgi:hypothetical protein
MLNQTITFHFKFSFIFLVMALFFGFYYSLNLMGYASSYFPPTYALSLHISLMLYGFPSLMLSMLPFALFEKDGLEDTKGAHYLNLYFIVWYIFLVFMIVSLMLGNQRGLVFYDYPYALNFLLAFSGLFYLLSILRYIKHYEVKPLWVKVSLASVIVSPFLLVLLMNPQYGQVEHMMMGPHGDNTLGMSFALLVLYYLVIKLHAHNDFKARFHWLWIVPLVLYVCSVLYRIVIGKLTYNQEWFFQWLTFLYVPALYYWFKDAKLKIKENMFLFISILAFVFVDIEGNILFIPHLRALFHRNDLVVGHAHIAVGLSMLFLSFAVVKRYFTIQNIQIILWGSFLTFMAVVLSISGFGQAGFMPIFTEKMWILRSLFGFLFFVGVLKFYSQYIHIGTISKLDVYHLVGFASDGLGAFVLLVFGASIYAILGESYHIGYQFVVYGFMFAVGMMHLLGFIVKKWQVPMAWATVLSRIMAGALFFALYSNGTLGFIALGVSLYDLFYALFFILVLYAI